MRRVGNHLQRGESAPAIPDRILLCVTYLRRIKQSFANDWSTHLRIPQRAINYRPDPQSATSSGGELPKSLPSPVTG